MARRYVVNQLTSCMAGSGELVLLRLRGHIGRNAIKLF